jgi:uncharacterized membrane protein (UPF0127 family)
VPKKTIVGGLALLFLVFVSLFVYQAKFACDIKIVNECLSIESVSSKEDKSIGLSKYNQLPKNKGMLFVYSEPQQICIWMRGMKFSIDIIWLNEQNQVIKLEEGVSPSTYPESFCSDDSAKYVLEVNEGTVGRLNIQPGDTIDL